MGLGPNVLLVFKPALNVVYCSWSLLFVNVVQVLFRAQGLGRAACLQRGRSLTMRLRPGGTLSPFRVLKRKRTAADTWCRTPGVGHLVSTPGVDTPGADEITFQGTATSVTVVQEP